MANSLTLLKSGLFTSVQDMGRIGLQKYGVPVSGAMDHFSAAIANSLVSNAAGEAVLEITLIGPELLFNSDTVIALTGADLSPRLNGEPIKMNFPICIPGGSKLSFGKINYGARSYLAVKGGILSDIILNSRSLCKGITPIESLAKGLSLTLASICGDFTPPTSSFKPDKDHFTNPCLMAYPGPEFYELPTSVKERILTADFTVSAQNNRMGYRLSGPELAFSGNGNMITSSVLPGTVQLTPSGQLIVLMRDCQTTGGYPRVLILKRESINRLAQKKAGDRITFQLLPNEDYKTKVK